MILPVHEKALVQLIVDVDDDIVVGGHVDGGTWELVIDSNNLTKEHRMRCSRSCKLKDCRK